MGAGYLIRPAQLADVPRLAELEPRCFSDPWSPAGFREMLSNPAILGLIAEGKGPGKPLAGYLMARAIEDEGEILNLAVDPGRRRRGIGTLLLDSALERLSQLGVNTIFLEVRVSNRPAINLYLARGFHPIGQRHGYYRRPVEDAMVLSRESPAGRSP